MFLVLPLHIGHGLSYLYLFDEQSIVYVEHTQTLVGLDTSATWTLLALEKGWEIPVEVSGVSAVRQLLDLGTVDEVPFPISFPPVLKIPPINDDKTGMRIQVLSKIFLVRGDDLWQGNLATVVKEFLSPYQVDLEMTPEVTVDIGMNSNGYFLVFNGLNDPVFNALHPEQLLPALLDRICQLSYEGGNHLLRAHAAVMSDDHRTRGLLLPGASGSGKSTLTAALVAHGWRMLSDEIAVITADTGEALSLPFPIKLKRESWSVLRDVYPTIEQSPIYRRLDRLDIRYLPLREDCIVPHGYSRPISHIVFPSYRNGIKHPTLTPIGPVDVLRRLAADGYQTFQPLNATNVEVLLTWLQNRLAYSLTYGSTSQAIMALNEIFI